MACLCGLCGSAEILAWAALDLPLFFVQGGIILITLGVLLCLRALIFRKRANWTLSLTGEYLLISRGSKRTVVRWSEVRSVTLKPFRMTVHGSATPLARLVLDTRACNPTLLAEMRSRIDQCIAGAQVRSSRSQQAGPQWR